METSPTNTTRRNLTLRDRLAFGRTFATRSCAMVALLVFVVINVVLPIYDNIEVRIKSAHAPAHELAGNCLKTAVEELHKSPRTKDSTVLMGSSVLWIPVWKCDMAMAPGAPINFHRSKWLEKYLQSKTVKEPDVVNLAIPGAFVSDQFLITDKLLNGSSKPGMIIYGMVPRDFMDSNLSGPALTPTFDSLMELNDLLRLSDLFFDNFQEKADLAVGKIVYLFGKRGLLQARAGKTADELFHVHGADPTEIKFDPKNPQAYFSHEALWARSVKEYRNRYKYFNVEQFEKQKKFLDALMALCKERDIQLVLVNMPLTKDNIALMPAGLYEQYISFIDATASRHNVPFIDLQKRAYSDSDFYDTAHLNEQGGAKVLSLAGDLIAGRLKQQTQNDGRQLSTSVCAEVQ